ncbi:MAG: indolepyruvate ferredoxin oxidoreductase subunit alpha, partial [Desulfobacterales bacterium]|nr:indolepyruvate ferredoxin oxidoreductase subunit alpha [Desulfobacterales bacterium]
LSLRGLHAGGLVLVTGEDPSSHSSAKEQDSRMFSKMADLPLLEPATFQEAKEMTKWAFEISEKIASVCMIRGVTRISHARGNVTLGELSKTNVLPYFDKTKPRWTAPVQQNHNRLHENLERIQEIFETSSYNQYDGPTHPEILIITCGSGWLYSQEALEILELEDRVGILKIGTTWPLPEKMIVNHLDRTDNVLIIEEVDPFLEGNIKEIAADFSQQLGPKQFFGRKSHHIPFFGEMTIDRVVDALKAILKIDYNDVAPQYDACMNALKDIVPNRILGFCAGCPHRASLWNIKNALTLDNKEGFVTGDIGCYAFARLPAGYILSKTTGAMGTGTGLASGFGKLDRFGFEQPVISLCGDSTFFHAAMPALVNAHYNNANMLMVILDNSATAMTGFQPHPGVGRNAVGEEVTPVDIEGVCRAFGARVKIADPFDLKETQKILLQMLEEKGAKVLIMRRKCALLRLKEQKPPFKMHIDPERCRGEGCGCNQYCTRIFKCPGLIWDTNDTKARIDDVICAGCGVCCEICPEGAIVKKEAC